MQKFRTIPHAIFDYNRIVLYDEPINRKRKEITNSASLSNFFCNKTKGILSNSSKKKIRKTIQLWMNAIECKAIVSRKSKDWIKSQINFTTLTLPATQFHTDKEIKRDLLNRFLIELRRKNNNKSYLWVAEKQKNSNIHFHILSEKYTDWKLIRSIWNSILNDFGYIEKYRDNQKEFHKNGFQLRTDKLEFWSEKKQREAYEYGIISNWSDPNSTDIHSLKKIKNIGSYVTKYLTKGFDLIVEEEFKKRCKSDFTDVQKNNLKYEIVEEWKKKLAVDGRLWGYSDNLKELLKADIVVISDVEHYLQNLINIEKKEIYQGDCFSVIKGTSLFELRNKSPSLFNEFCLFQNHNYSKIYNS